MRLSDEMKNAVKHVIVTERLGEIREWLSGSYYMNHHHGQVNSAVFAAERAIGELLEQLEEYGVPPT